MTRVVRFYTTLSLILSLGSEEYINKDEAIIST